MLISALQLLQVVVIATLSQISREMTLPWQQPWGFVGCKLCLLTVQCKRVNGALTTFGCSVFMRSKNRVNADLGTGLVDKMQDFVFMPS